VEAVNLILENAPTTRIGGQLNGVLGDAEMMYAPSTSNQTANGNPYLQFSGYVTVNIVEGWNWYTGVNPALIGSNQYDYQTVVTHELSHAVGLYHRQRDFFFQLQKAILVQFHAVQVEANQEFVRFIFRNALHHGLKQEEAEQRGVLREQAFRGLRTTGETVGQVQCPGDHDARVGIHPISRRGALVGDADSQFQPRQVVGLGFFIVGEGDS